MVFLFWCEAASIIELSIVKSLFNRPRTRDEISPKLYCALHECTPRLHSPFYYAPLHKARVTEKAQERHEVQDIIRMLLSMRGTRSDEHSVTFRHLFVLFRKSILNACWGLSSLQTWSGTHTYDPSPKTPEKGSVSCNWILLCVIFIRART